MPIIKILHPGDEEPLKVFLCQYSDTSMFLRSNLHVAGLENTGAPLQGIYVAAFEGDEIVAVVAHCGNGMLLVQAPVHLKAVVEQIVAISRSQVKGISGPWLQALATQEILQLTSKKNTSVQSEILFGLELANLQIPPALATEKVKYRLPRVEELDLLTQWRVAFCQEMLGMSYSEELYQHLNQQVQDLQASQSHCVAVVDDTPLSYAATNARLPNMVQLGGIWTVPEWRGKGYGRCAVAGLLLNLASQGVKRAILFTAQNNYAAQQVYFILGFEVIGEYGLLLF
jgi:predicted GNAT family acetyltransferase